MLDFKYRKYNGENPLQNPLLEFRLFSLKKQRHSFYLKQLAARQKLKLTLNNIKEESEEELATMPSKDLKSKLQIYASQVPVPKMPKSVENKIVKFCSKKKAQKHTEIVKDYMEDVRKQYDLLMQKFSIEQQIRSNNLEYSNNKLCTKERNKKGSLTFLKTRKQFEKRFILTQQIVYTTLEFIIKELPAFECNFQLSTIQRAVCQQGLLGRNAISYDLLLNSIRKDIEAYNNLLSLTWYPKLLSMIKELNGKKHVSERIYVCLEGLIARQIIEMKQNALTDLLQMLSNERALPTLCFRLETYEDGIILNPTLQAVEEMYVSLAVDIANLGVGMLPTLAIALHTHGCFYSKHKKYIKLEMNEIYIAEWIADIRNTVRQTYEPVRKYVEHFHRRFITINSTIELSDVACNFKTTFAKIEAYSKLKSTLQFEPKNVFFLTAIIQNNQVLYQLSQFIETLRQHALEQLTKKHIVLLQEICNNFQTLKSRALKMPTSTEELLALTAFINKIELKELFDRVNYAQKIVNQLLEVTVLSETHLELNIRTLNWLREIETVQQMAATQLDNFATVFRGHLKAVTNKLCQNIEKLATRAQLLISINDSSKSRELRIFIQSLLRQLNELEDCVSWINKEEYLFAIPKSQFPALEEVKETVGKFVK